MIEIDPAQFFSGVVVFIAPHMDDEVLACGGTIANLPQKDHIHLIYATDGTKSPVPLYPWQGAVSLDLKAIREREAIAALAVLGVPEKNLHFWGLPDGDLKNHQADIRRSLKQCIRDLKPDFLFIPFRYDRHPDHLALYRSCLTVLEQEEHTIQVVEYFVYNRFRLLRGGDIREFIRPELLIKVDIHGHTERKKRALDCYRSQTTILFDWQERPILPEARVEEVSHSPELFLLYDSSMSDASIFAHSALWVRVVHIVEPYLKLKKEQINALIRRRNQGYGGQSV